MPGRRMIACTAALKVPALGNGIAAVTLPALGNGIAALKVPAQARRGLKVRG